MLDSTRTKSNEMKKLFQKEKNYTVKFELIFFKKINPKIDDDVDKVKICVDSNHSNLLIM